MSPGHRRMHLAALAFSTTLGYRAEGIFFQGFIVTHAHTYIKIRFFSVIPKVVELMDKGSLADLRRCHCKAFVVRGCWEESSVDFLCRFMLFFPTPSNISVLSTPKCDLNLPRRCAGPVPLASQSNGSWGELGQWLEQQRLGCEYYFKWS